MVERLREGCLAQLVECVPYKDTVSGSSPLAPILLFFPLFFSPRFFLCMDFGSVFVLLLVAGVLALTILGGSLLVGHPRRADIDTEAAYECGFEPFDDARGRFDIKFYLVAILFIIFDLEVSFLFPWALSLSHTGIFGFYVMMVFLMVLTVGFVYEWTKGALDW